MYQVGLLFIVVYAILLLTISIFSRLSIRIQAISTELGSAFGHATELSTKLGDYESISFLMSYWTEHPDIMASQSTRYKTNESYLNHLKLSFLESVSDNQQRICAIQGYHALTSLLDIASSLEYGALNGPFVVAMPKIGSNILCYAPTDEYFDVGQSITFVSTDFTYSNFDFINSSISVSRYLLKIETKEDTDTWAIYSPITYDGRIIGLTIYLVDLNFLRNTSFTVADFILEFAIVLVIVTGLIFVLILFNAIVKPIILLQKALRIYTKSLDPEEFEKNLNDIKSKNEIGRLADDMNTLVKRIVTYSEEKEHLISDKARLQSELSLAADIQLSMLPTNFPDPEMEQRFELYATMNPAKEVGGDLYDFFFIDDDHLAIVVADVSGKGVPASLFMMRAITIIRDRSVPGKAPSEILSEVNRELYEQNKNKLFITTWLLIIELSTGKALETNAGHEKPLISHRSESYEYIVTKHNLALGIRNKIKLTDNEWQLMPGDKIFMYTDGVTEATSSDQQLFGPDRLNASLDQARTMDQRAILENVKKNIEHFVGDAEQFDDMTMLGFTYKNKA